MGNTARKQIPQGMPEEWYDQRTAYMAEFMMPERLETLRRVLDERTRWMTVCMENTFHPHNASALLRTCEAFGIQDIHTIEELCKFDPSTNIVRGTDKWLTLRRHNSAGEAIANLKKAGYRIVATTPHREDTTPETFDVAKGPFALVFGTEHAGISEEVIGAADEFLRIPMCGFVESLNVSASAAILLHDLSARLRGSDVNWRLAEDEKRYLLFKWVMSSVRDSQRILAKRFGE